MGLKILHISDLHLGEENQIFKNAEEFAGHIVDALNGKVPDVILVSGDVFNGKQFSESKYVGLIEEAKQYFITLIKEISKISDVKITMDDVLFVPGNHEVFKPNASEGKDVFTRYDEFLNAFYGKRPAYYSTRYYSFFRQYDEQKVIVVGFCSPCYPKGTKEEPYGEIQLGEIREAISNIKAVHQYEDYQIVVVLHHHFYAVEERNKNDVDNSGLRNSETFLKKLQDYNVCLFLHGHKHASMNRRININIDIEKEDRLVTVLGCGATAKTKGLNTNSMNLIEVFKLNHAYDMEYIEYEYKSSTFELIRTIKLPHTRKTREVMSIFDEIEEYADLYDQYRALKDLDINMYAGLDTAMNDALHTLPEVAIRIRNNPDILYYLLAAMHYRSNWRKRNESNFMKEIMGFLSSTLIKDFPQDKQQKQVKAILETESIYSLAQNYDTAKEVCDNNRQKELLTFMALGIMLTEFYVIVKYETEAFFKEHIAQKADFVNAEDEITHGIIGNKIVFSSNEDRRSLGISVKCKNAAAHKTVSLVVKEFELILIRLEQDFTEYGFKIFYIYPEIVKQIGSTTSHVESYNFSAYIPTLIPLLAGRSIYAHPEAFARELIQNSIDAIGTRAEVDDNFIPEIKITFSDENNKPCFRISDNGSGMNKYILERYLTTAGRSFYTSSDYTLDYKPISQFGIGFLSCFMLGKHITVDTMYLEVDTHTHARQAYYLDIPNFDGCFFIEDGDKETIGTKITIYPNPDLAAEDLHFDIAAIQKYIKANILNAKYPIWLADSEMKEYGWEKEIQKNTAKYGVYFHIPLAWANDKLVVSDEAMETSYGIYFYLLDEALFCDHHELVLNCGIKMEKTMPFREIDKRFSTHGYYDCCMNFPSSVLKLDVSRDKLAWISNVDWDGIFKAFDQEIDVFVEKSTYKKLPLLYAYILDPNKASLKNLNICYENGGMLLINKAFRSQNRIEMIKMLFKQIVKRTIQFKCKPLVHMHNISLLSLNMIIRPSQI